MSPKAAYKPFRRKTGINNKIDTIISKIGITHAATPATGANTGEEAIVSLKRVKSMNLLMAVYTNRITNNMEMISTKLDFFMMGKTFNEQLP